jgi:hypothetical protein
MMPKSIEGMLRHYRLSTRSGIVSSLAEDLVKSAEILMQEEGLEEALERLLCIPVRIPDLIVNELARQPEGDQLRLLRRSYTRCSSPISCLHLIDLSLRVGEAKKEFVEIARAALTWLSEADDGRKRFEYFQQTLQMTSSWLARWKEASSLSLATRLVLVWAHATKIHNIYGRIGTMIAFKSLKEWAEIEKLFSEDEYLNDVLHPRHVHYVTFLTQGLCAVFADRSKEVAEEIQVAQLISKIAFENTDHGLLPNIHLFLDTTLALNQADSFFGHDRTDAIRSVLGKEVVRLLSSEALREWARSAIAKLTNDPSDWAEWVKLLWVINDLPIYAELASSFRELIQKLDLIALARKNTKTCAIAIRVIATQIDHLKDESLRLKFEEDLLQIVLQDSERPENAGTKSGKPDYQGMDEVVFEIALKMLYRNSPMERRESTKGLLLRMIEYSAQFQNLVPGFIRVANVMPFNKARKLWPVILAARSTA